MRNKKVAILMVLSLVFVMASCAATMSTKGKALMVLSTYNAQTASTVEMSNRPNLTEAQKEVVREKKKVIMQLDPMIKLYGNLVKKGGTPSTTTEQDIFNLIDQLATIGQ